MNELDLRGGATASRPTPEGLERLAKWAEDTAAPLAGTAEGYELDELARAARAVKRRIAGGR